MNFSEMEEESAPNETKNSRIYSAIFILSLLVIIVATITVFLNIQTKVEDVSVVSNNIQCPIPHENNLPAKYQFPKTLKFGSIVNETIEELKYVKINMFINHFTSFASRNHESDAGVEVAEWLISQLTSYSNYSTVNVIIRKFLHSWKRPSVILRFEGADSTLKSQLVVLGAHLDSINYQNPSDPPPPGANDNAITGCAILFETAVALLESDFIPKRSVEFHWYAGSQAGLVGSKEISESYTNSSVNVISMVNFDIVGYNKDHGRIGFITDYTDNALNAFLQRIVSAYLSLPFNTAQCGNKCSDHASWYDHCVPSASLIREGFPTSFSNYKEPNNTNSTLSIEQIEMFAKLAISYVVQVAEPN